MASAGEHDTKSLRDVFDEARALAMPLAQRLGHLDRGLRDLGPEWAAAYDVMVKTLTDAKAGAGAPRAGAPFPRFLLPDEIGQLIDSATLLAKGPLVVSFNRGHWCEFCLLELNGLDEIAAAVSTLGASIVAIMPERTGFTRRCRADNRLTFPILSDIDLSLALALGLAIPVSPRVLDLLRADGVLLAEVQGSAGWLLPIPATFVVARDGTIAACHVDPDFRQRLEPADILAALRSL